MSRELPFENEYRYVMPPPFPNEGQRLTLRVGRYKGYRAYWIVDTDSGKVVKRPNFYNLAAISGILELAGVLPTS